MKTLTEFSGFVLKEALAKKAALLAEGKSEEEAQAAVNEQLKLDETKVGFFKNVVDMTGSRRDSVKRVVVAVKATDAEKVPESFQEREGHFYLVEYFHQSGAKHESRGRDDDRGGFGRDRKGGGGGRDGGRDGGPRRPRGDRDRGGSDRRENRRETKGFHHEVAAPAPSENARPPRGPRPPRPPRAPRPEGSQPRPPREGGVQAKPRGPRPPKAPRSAPKGPKGAGELRLVLKGQSSQTLQGSGTAEVATSAAPDTPQA